MSELVPVYVKANRRLPMCTWCLSSWAPVLAGADVYLVCDWDEATIAQWVPPEFEYREVVRTTDRARAAVHRKVAPFWRPAGAAQMTATDHATVNGIEQYWAIDGDDTMFPHEPELVLAKLVEVQAVMHEQDISAASLDMYQTYLDHWSFGVACFRADADYFELLAAIDPHAVADHFPNEGVRGSRGGANRDGSSRLMRGPVATDINVDWIFTYMRDLGILRAASFYFADMYFFHAGMGVAPELDLGGFTMRGLYHWKDGSLWDDPVPKEVIRI
jgi:hypothetical protein